VGDILTRNEGDLARAFGDGWREVVAMARGQDTRPVEMTDEDAKSYSQQETFHEDLGDFAAVARIAKRMVDELLALVRADGKRVKTITVKVRYGDFTQMAHGRSLATASDLEVRFYPLVETLLREAWTQRRKLRLVSVRFSGVEHGAEQLEMFNQSDEKRRKLAAVLDRMNAGEKKPRVLHGHQLGAEEPS
jgi:DNA polymerase-4